MQDGRIRFAGILVVAGLLLASPLLAAEMEGADGGDAAGLGSADMMAQLSAPGPETQNLESLPAASRKTCRLRGSVGFSAVQYGSENYVIRGDELGSGFRLETDYACGPVVRLAGVIDDGLEFEGSFSLERYGFRVVTLCDDEDDSEFTSVLISLGPALYLRSVDVHGHDLRWLIRPAVTWREFDMDLDYPVRSFSSGPGVQLETGLVWSHLEWRCGVYWGEYGLDDYERTARHIHDLRLLGLGMEIACRF